MTPREIAPGVYWLALGRGLRSSNVYFVRSEGSWCLIDAGWPRDALPIRQAAASQFGRDARPTSILLTHYHPDHAGAARELARLWDLPVWMHAAELPLACADVQAIHRYAGPLDRWVILPALRLMGSKRVEATLAKSSLEDIARPLELAGGPPGLPEWKAIATPGHTPGHVAFFRGKDRVLITGDALVTVNLNSWRGILLAERTIAAPPWYTTWDWPAARASAVALAQLGFRVLGPGHGVPMTGAQTREKARQFLERPRG